MTESLLSNEPAVRLAAFAGALCLMALWEMASPRRRREIPRLLRWGSNLGIVVVNTLLVRVAFPTAAVGLALLAESRGWGLFNLVPVPTWLAFLASLLAFDLLIYFQHRLFHAVPLFWRLHRMHHADLEFDFTTAVRFHPLEILLSMVIKIGVVFLLGPPAVAVLVFEIVLNAVSIFNHANVRLPLGLDRVLRWIIVTPDMHRVHHSIRREETDSNFGFNLTVWDRLFGTYRGQPLDGHEGMVIGLSEFRSRRDLRLDRMLIQPFRGKDDRAPPP